MEKRPPCSVCGKPNSPDYRPFCSKRCADVDLSRWLTGGYVAGVAGVLKRPIRILLIYALLIGGAGYLFRVIPGSFIPEEDQGMLMVSIQLPSGLVRQSLRLGRQCAASKPTIGLA